MSDALTPRRDAPDLDPEDRLVVSVADLSTLLASVESGCGFESPDAAMQAAYRAGYGEGAAQLQLAILEHADRLD
jgi:hypothetical protein